MKDTDRSSLALISFDKMAIWFGAVSEPISASGLSTFRAQSIKENLSFLRLKASTMPSTVRKKKELHVWLSVNLSLSFSGHGHGHHTVLDDRYELVTQVRAGHHRLTDKAHNSSLSLLPHWIQLTQSIE
jgi:uncharacterized protein